MSVLASIAAWLAGAAGRHEAERLLSQSVRHGAVRLRMPAVIYAPEKIEFGDQVDIGEFTHIRANGGLRIGSRVLIAAHVTITTREHPVELPRWAVTRDAPIVIEDDVWIGAGAVILPGVTIGAGSVVAAGAVVTESVAARVLVGGVPARVIRPIA